MDTGDTTNSIFGDIHPNAIVIQARDVLYSVGHRTDPDYDSPWQRMVNVAQVWEHVDAEQQAKDAGQHAKKDAVETVGRLAALLGDIRDDPWLDRGFVERFHRRVGWLLLKRPDLRLDPAEAALLVLVPFLHQVLWTGAAVRACDGVPDVDPGFARDHGRLANLAERRPDAGAAIRWWLFHRWLALRIEVVRQESVAKLLAEAEFPPYLRTEWVQALLYGLRLEPSALCSDWLGGLRPHETVFGGTAEEQRVRLPLLGLLLSVARAMAIEATELSETVVWHVGIPATPVNLKELHATLAATEWDHTTLVATCQHAAVEEALREHLTRVDDLLQAIGRVAQDREVLAPLRSLPERVNADRVLPARRADGEPLFRGWNRFNLDEQRVQELLMGDQLYRDRGLAIRELYQNALDACRYRRAREEYLARRSGRSVGWSGEITFTQGTEGEQPYLECVDNGVGMGIAELTGVFSRAGARFPDLTEFRDEQADWAALNPPIEVFPNSRFGIGVMSYFMLADEIMITTCRMNRSTGLPGPTLKVTIAGPGHLFHIEKVDDRSGPGTTVRLNLRSGTDVSCVRVLDRLLGIAEFTTTARHDTESIHWPPGKLRPRAEGKLGELVAHGRTVETTDANVVWCEFGGAILVDGLLAEPLVRTGILPAGDRDEVVYGVVVNLTGRHSPRLSVDRTQILDDISVRVEQMVSAVIEELVESGSAIPDRDWLGAVTMSSPRLADLILARWAAVRTYFSPDWALVPSTRRARSNHSKQDRVFTSGDTLDAVTLWRLLAHAPNKTINELSAVVPELADVGPVLDARPSDLTVLTGIVGENLRWLGLDKIGIPGHIFEVASITGRSPRTVARRITELGLIRLEPSSYPDGTHRYATEIEIFSSSTGNWLSPAESLPFGHVRRVAAKLHTSSDAVLDVLHRYGFATPPTAEQILRSRNLDGTEPTLSLSEPVPQYHAARAAMALDSTMVAVLQMLRDLDFELASELPEWLDDHMARRLTQECQDHDRLEIGHVGYLSRMFGTSIEETIVRIEQLGLGVPYMPASLTDIDMRILSRDLDDSAPWLRQCDLVPQHHLLRAQWRVGLPLPDIAARLRDLGYHAVLSNEPQIVDAMLLAAAEERAILSSPLRLSQLVELRRDLSMPIVQIANRLRELGVEVSDVAEMIRATLTKVPLSPETP